MVEFKSCKTDHDVFCEKATDGSWLRFRRDCGIRASSSHHHVVPARCAQLYYKTENDF
jgi:hypothetical protein